MKLDLEHAANRDRYEIVDPSGSDLRYHDVINDIKRAGDSSFQKHVNSFYKSEFGIAEKAEEHMDAPLAARYIKMQSDSIIDQPREVRPGEIIDWRKGIAITKDVINADNLKYQDLYQRIHGQRVASFLKRNQSGQFPKEFGDATESSNLITSLLALAAAAFIFWKLKHK